jgi:predicted phage terminase large subunit-like protein
MDLYNPADRLVMRRELARVNFREFLKQSFPVVKRNRDARLDDDWYFGPLAEHAEAFLAGELKRLVVTTPPGTYKSRSLLVALIAWQWLRKPGERFLAGTNDYDLGLELSRDTRHLIESPWYQGFGPDFRIEEKDAQELFTNTRGGQRQVVSVGSTVTGKKATKLLLDDAHDARQVHSPTERNSVIRWFWDAFFDRVDNFVTDGILVVGHRLVRDDLEGDLIARGWPELSFMERMETAYRKTWPLGGLDPRQEGEYLRPARFGPQQEAEAKQTSEANWQGKHQQRPVSVEGTMFPKESLPESVPTWKAGTTAVRFWDTAASTKATASHTSGVLIGRDPAGRFPIINVKRGRWDWSRRDTEILKTAQEDAGRSGMTVAHIVIEHPGGSGGLQAYQILAQRLAGFSVSVQPTSSEGNKVVRAGPLSTQWKAGNVYVVSDGTWDVAGFLDRMEAFPGLTDKDDTDAAGGGFNYLAAGNVAAGVEPGTGTANPARGDAGPTAGPLASEPYPFDVRSEKW